jgi:hypothetical protein
LKALTETIPSKTKRTMRKSDRRIAALRASAPPEVIGFWVSSRGAAWAALARSFRTQVGTNSLEV